MVGRTINSIIRVSTSAGAGSSYDEFDIASGEVAPSSASANVPTLLESGRATLSPAPLELAEAVETTSISDTPSSVSAIEAIADSAALEDGAKGLECSSSVLASCAWIGGAIRGPSSAGESCLCAGSSLAVKACTGSEVIGGSRSFDKKDVMGVMMLSMVRADQKDIC